MPKRRPLLRRLALAVVILILAVPAVAWLGLHAGLARLDGKLNMPGLNAPVTVERDALGVASIRGSSRRDVYFALGFVHAQERFFEMDLMRRVAAGELAELVGPAAVASDERNRRLRLRAHAQAGLATLSEEDRASIAAYRQGVNAGLEALGSRPWEYWVLRGAPRPWSDEDSLLVIGAMYLDLNDATNARELAFAKIRAALGENVYKFLSTSGGPWDAPLSGPPMKYPDLPSAAEIDISKLDPKLLSIPASAERPVTPGSNSFAVAGALTSTHAALVANDMHLNLRVPNIWFRARLTYPSPRRAGDTVDLVGVTLPGLPALVAGSNRHVAWAFTNSYGDWTDWVRVVPDPADKSRYRTAQGSEPVREIEETIKVHGAPDEKITVRETQFGPILAEDTDGTPLALMWTALRPGGLDVTLAHLDVAESVDEAMEVANRCGMPPQNFVVGDRAGNIGWTIAGRIPRREGGYDPRLPADFSVAGTGWNGWFEPAEYPHIGNPPSQRLWTANTRTLDWEGIDYAHEGDGGYDLGARARQIRDDLKAKDRFAPDDMLAIQLDDRAILLTHWHDLLAETLKHAPDSPGMALMKQYADDWDGRADPSSAGYRLTRDFRKEILDTVMDGFAAAVRAKYKDYTAPHLPQAEVLVDAILVARPPHLLPPGYADWDDLLRKCAARIAAHLRDAGPTRTWGDAIATHIRHPLSRALPWLGWLLDAPSEQLPGDSNMPRVQAESFGASERFAVEPGHEEFGYFHMPGGQSDNPLSPFYLAGHEDWARGKAAPFLPGAAKYTLTLAPR